MTSQARKDLTGRLDEVQLLSSSDPVRKAQAIQPTLNPSTSEMKLSNAINRACLILLSAHVEGFLEDVVVEALDALVTHGANVDQLPLLLRALHAEDHLKNIEHLKDVNMRAPKIEKMFITEAALWGIGTPIQQQMIRAKMVCGEMNNPGSREMRRFLALLGVDIENHLSRAGAANLTNQLNGLVGKRNAIAHGEVGASATFTDIDNYLSMISELCRHIDDAVAETIRKICKLSALPW
ncbi:MAE_28990/MAE_18760 family HEPN-like nuclease [Myxococcus xanthus]|uniref:MAE_28990/MAE_18760 family HEPN-like nuclease n=1 Tax=Myxococcus xanthus TaxID=34 RepID=UPI00112B4581|nr:MAE_28990/MAE_18760 family HEPN-like nuclease [Myxococcus xanthus]